MRRTTQGRLGWPVAAVAGLFPGIAAAQCQEWQPIPLPIPGMFEAEIGCATWWDQDGPGPAPMKLVLGGSFSDTFRGIHRVATWTPGSTGWSPLGALVPVTNTSVWWVLVDAESRLLIGGTIQLPDGPLVGVARWTGTGWEAMPGAPERSFSAVSGPNGELVLSGEGWPGLPASDTSESVARWDGAQWVRLPGRFSSRVLALCVLQDGSVVAGGAFTSIDSRPFMHVARWTGSDWSVMGQGLAWPRLYSETGSVSRLLQTSDGSVLARGEVTSSGSESILGIPRWNGTAWGSFLGEVRSAIGTMALDPEGRLIVTGRLGVFGPLATPGVVAWDGGVWSPLGSGLDRLQPPGSAPDVRLLACSPEGDLAAFGSFGISGEQLLAGAAYLRLGTPGRPSLATTGVAGSACEGGSVTWTLEPRGDGPFSVRWSRGSVSEPMSDGPFPSSTPTGAVVTGTDGMSLTISRVDQGTQGRFRAFVINDCGYVATDWMYVRMTPPWQSECGGPGCDADYDQNGSIDQDDLRYLIDTIGSGENPTGMDLDFNQDGNVDQDDMGALVHTIAGGGCP